MIPAQVVAGVQQYFIHWKVIHSLFKSYILGYFDTVGLRIIPHDVLSHVGKESKEYSFERFGLHLGCAASWGPDSYSTTKGSEPTEVVLLLSSQEMRRVFLITRWDRVVNAEPMMECVRPELGRESSA